MAVRDTGATLRKVVLGASALLGAVGLYWIGRSFVVDGQLRFGNPVDVVEGAPAGAAVLEPIAVRAEVTRVTGAATARVGDKCEFLVQRYQRSDGASQCNAQVMCGDKLVYGGPDRGFFVCKIASDGRRDVLGSDPSTTSQDQDAAFHLDTHSGVLRVWDDEQGVLGKFSLEADVLSVQ